jgi:STE24 endopeptidase
MEQTLFYLIIAFVIGEYIFSTVLEYINGRNKSETLPERLKGIYDEEKYKKSQQYDQEKTRVGLISGTLSTAIIVVFLFTGGFAWLDGLLSQVTEHYILLPLLYFGVLFLASDIIGLPFSVYNTFVIEEKYGFNRTTAGTFLLDKLKGYLLTALIGGGIMALLIVIYHAIPHLFWLIGWVLVTVFSLFFATFYTSIIVPMFNKLEPLPDGELRQGIEDFADKVDFPLKNIYVMDSSKRSTKSNAFFSGMGKQKSIVLFDTLIEKHETEELVAVLAHEVGHYKKKHIQKSMILSAMQTGIIFLLLDFVLGSPAIAGALGASEPSFHINLIAFGLLFSPVSTIIGIGMNMFSRKNEYEADAFAAKNYSGAPLQDALKKLSVDNLSDLEPHPFYVFIHYSHPPVLDRLKELDKWKVEAAV